MKTDLIIDEVKMIPAAKEKKQRPNIANCLFFVLLSAAFFLSMWKIKFGFGGRDEAFYLMLPYRLYQGDSLFFDERQRCLLFSFLTYPIVKVYMMISGNTEGIIVNFRYIYLFLQTVSAIIIYLKLKRYSLIGAMISAIVFLLYAPFNIMALSYNTVAIACLTISLILLLNKDNPFELIVSGVLYAAAVLCCPFLAATYFVYSAYIAYQFFKNRGKRRKDIETWLYFSIGIMILALLFVVFVFSRISLTQFFESIGFVLSDETAHPSRSFFEIMVDYVEETVFFTEYSTILLGSHFVLFLMFLFDKKKEEHRDYFFAGFVLLGLGYLLHLYLVDSQINYLMFPISITGFFILLCMDRKKEPDFLYLYMIPAFLYTLYLSMASNTKTLAITSASSVTLVMSIVIIVRYMEGMNKDKLLKKGIVILTLVLMIAQVVTLLHSKMMMVFPKQSISTLNVTIEEGPFKNTRVDERTYDIYTDVNKQIEEIRSNYEERSIVFFSPYNWMYLLANDFTIASPSSWYTADINQINLLEDMNLYYAQNSTKRPGLIYVDEGFEKIVEQLDIISEYSLTYLSSGKELYVRKK